MRTSAVIAVLIGLVSLVIAQEGPATGDIVVRITNLRNDIGNAAVALYNSPDGFPGDSTKVYRADIGEISRGESRVMFRDVPYASYAIAVLHDENRNGKMEKGLFGIPKEGYGFSNDASGFMGPPDFDDAKFRLGSDSITITINVKY